MFLLDLVGLQIFDYKASAETNCPTHLIIMMIDPGCLLLQLFMFPLQREQLLCPFFQFVLYRVDPFFKLAIEKHLDIIFFRLLTLSVFSILCSSVFHRHYHILRLQSVECQHKLLLLICQFLHQYFMCGHYL